MQNGDVEGLGFRGVGRIDVGEDSSHFAESYSEPTIRNMANLKPKTLNPTKATVGSIRDTWKNVGPQYKTQKYDPYYRDPQIKRYP